MQLPCSVEGACTNEDMGKEMIRQNNNEDSKINGDSKINEDSMPCD